MKTHTTILCILSCFAALATKPACAASLTGVMVFSCDADGNPAGNFVWDTRGLDSDFYKVFLASGRPGRGHESLTAPFLNGPVWAEAPINVPLSNGVHRFALFFEYNGDWSQFAINLFFDSNSVPAISAKVPLRTGKSVSRFTVNTAPLTFSMTSYPTPDAPAAGTTRVRLDRSVRLVMYDVVAPAVFEQDRVDTHQVAASGRSDYIGAFALVVSSDGQPPKIQPSEPGAGHRLQKRETKDE